MRGTGSAYQQWLGHHSVLQVARIPRTAIRLQTPNAWQTGVLFDRHPRKDLLLFVVGNDQGICNFVNATALEHGLQQFHDRSKSGHSPTKYLVWDESC